MLKICHVEIEEKNNHSQQQADRFGKKGVAAGSAKSDPSSSMHIDGPPSPKNQLGKKRPTPSLSGRGELVGCCVVGAIEGDNDGEELGLFDGAADGLVVGNLVGLMVGDTVGK